MHYKDHKNNIHAIDSTDYEYLLPAGSIRITDDQAKEIVDSKVVPQNYQQLRAAAYPAAADYLDGIVKADQAQISAYIDACLAVKARFPK